ncbi:putative Secretion protein HlyD [Verrucomicrobia bacterium]|nr:putative Secretion protein HlyD [Verrucomicrobiota bacterium]
MDSEQEKQGRKKRRVLIWIVVVVVVCCAIYFVTRTRSRQVVITGIVTTDSVIVSSEIGGRLQELMVKEGDTVTNGQLLGLIQPQEQRADLAFYAKSHDQSAAQVAEAEAELNYQEAQTSNQIRQAEANLASVQAQRAQAQADWENASLTFKRQQDLYHQGVEAIQSYDQARTGSDAAKAHLDSLGRQVEAAEAALALARASREQVAMRRAALEASHYQLAAAAAQQERAKVRLGYTEIYAPTNGFVDLRAALPGEVVNSAQAIVTLIDPDNLWVRADIEETYIDRIVLGQKMLVRLPSGGEREGTVFFRGQDAEYATQRDVSRTKRDIKTFEIRLRCDNHDRRLAVGMSAYVILALR